MLPRTNPAPRPRRGRVARRGRAVGRRVAGLVMAAAVAAGQATVTGQATAAGQAPPLERVGAVPVAAGVLAATGHLLIAGAGTGVDVFDVSRPEAVTRVGRYDFEQPVLDLVPDGSDGRIVYVANSHDGLRRLDLADPAAPVVSGTLATRGQAVGVARSGRHVFVGDNSLGFDVVDTGDALRRVGEYLGDGFPRDIAAAGSLVFLADQPAGLVVVDVTDPAAPTVAGGLSLGREPVTGIFVPAARSWDAGQPPVAALVSGTAGLQVVDVSNPVAPTVTAPVAPAGRFAGVAMWADRLFVAGDGVLRVFDLTDPGRPALVAESGLGGEAGAVVVGEAFVFVATPQEVVIFRNP